MAEGTVFHNLRRFRKIIVTGPLRSGTTICARMIAQDTGYDFIDENLVMCRNFDMAYSIWKRHDKFVMQIPNLSAYCHLFGDDDTLVCFMFRKISDIKASEDRIGFSARENLLQLKPYFRTEGDNIHVKYAMWEGFQKHQIKHKMEIDYERLKKHPLYIEKHLRKDFGVKQTEPGPKYPPLHIPAFLKPTEEKVMA